MAEGQGLSLKKADGWSRQSLQIMSKEPWRGALFAPGAQAQGSEMCTVTIYAVSLTGSRTT